MGVQRIRSAPVFVVEQVQPREPAQTCPSCLRAAPSSRCKKPPRVPRRPSDLFRDRFRESEGWREARFGWRGVLEPDPECRPVHERVDAYADLVRALPSERPERDAGEAARSTSGVREKLVKPRGGYGLEARHGHGVVRGFAPRGSVRSQAFVVPAQRLIERRCSLIDSASVSNLECGKLRSDS